MTVADDGPLVLCEQRDAVMVLTLNRPARLNAWTNDLEDQYFDLLEAAEDDERVRAIVVTGAGRGFCSGADMANLSRIEGAPERARRIRPRSFPLQIDKPLIAAINGAAAGLGLVQALYCDVRFCVPEAKLTTAFARRGLIAEYGLSHLLSALVGPGRAMDLLLTGRIVRGAEAVTIGLVEQLAEPDQIVDIAVAYAQELADLCSPRSMAIIKGQLRDEQRDAFERSLARADRLMLASFDGEDVREGVASHLERRKPQFAPLPARGEREGLEPTAEARS